MVDFLKRKYFTVGQCIAHIGTEHITVCEHCSSWYICGAPGADIGEIHQ